MATSSDNVNSAIGSETAQRLVSDIIRRAGSSESFDARSILGEHPELWGHHSVVIDLAYEEYCRRVEAGEEVDAAQFADGFGDHGGSLLQVLQVHEYIEADARFQSRTFDKWPRAGDEFLGCILVEEIGRGAFSRVFVARQPQLGDRHIVVKVCINGSDEAHVLGRLEHPHIVPVYSVEHDPAAGLTAICMPLLSRATLHDVVQHAFAGGQLPRHGRTLLEVVRELNAGEQRLADFRPLSGAWSRLGPHLFVDEIVRLGVQLAEALAYTHSQGLFHCDVKPSNVLLTPDGRAMLLDFNLAFGQRPGEKNVGGTLPYMAPEQLRAIADPPGGAPAVDQRTDVFALGVTLYESLSGELPFGSVRNDGGRKQMARALLARQRRGHPPLELQNRYVDPRFARLIDQSLRLDPAERPQSAVDFAEQLRRAITPGWRTRRWARSRRRLLAVAGCLAVALSLVAMTVWLNREPYLVAQLRQGDEALKARDFAAAANFYSNALTADPQDKHALFCRGRARMAMEQFEEAEVDFRNLINLLDERNGLVLSCLAHCISSSVTVGLNAPEFTIPVTEERGIAVAQKSLALKRAVALYTEAIHLGIETSAIYNNLGFCYYERNLWKDAEESYHKATTFETVPSASYVALAKIDRKNALRNKRNPKLAFIESALKQSSDLYEVQFHAACVFALAAQRQIEGSMDKSMDYFDRALTASEMAVKRGLPRKFLSQVPTFLPQIKEHPRFVRIESIAESAAAQSMNYLVDPLDEIPNLYGPWNSGHGEQRFVGFAADSENVSKRRLPATKTFRTGRPD